MLRFSQRKGLAPISSAIQTKGMSQELRNSLWNIHDMCVWQKCDIDIKASISAIETMAKIITGKGNTTLGDALKTLERGKKINQRLKEGFEKLCAYTNDKNGIRHGMDEETWRTPNISSCHARHS